MDLGNSAAARTDLKALGYSSPEDFPVADSEIEVANMPNATLIPVPSVWGHFAGGPRTNPQDVDFIDAKLKELLAS